VGASFAVFAGARASASIRNAAPAAVGGVRFG
jgi:hypothetical protein